MGTALHIVANVRGRRRKIQFKNQHKQTISRSRSEANCFFAGFFTSQLAAALAKIHGKIRINAVPGKKAICFYLLPEKSGR
tara:strand:- start:43 stop:285 length:243 start_codon:yes stop_codon:yes gene_type:complete